MSAHPLLPSVEDYMAEQVAALGFASIDEVLAVPPAMPVPRWGDPIRVGERVHLSLDYLQAMHPAGRLFMQRTFVTSGPEGNTGGVVTALGEDGLYWLATVEWDGGRVQKLHVGSLIQSDLRQNEAIRFHAGREGDAL
ncbi:hypothetical protein [Sphingomonas sp. VNH70]|uniref:hypothetical protein n=1 Tax=Sphingomonas silueang TaxID=3156617 RepID=UPI0032B57BAE